MDDKQIHPSRRVLVVVIFGGTTNSDPMFVICQRLHERGHTIEFATLPGREHFASGWPMVSKVHTIQAKAITKEDDEAFQRHLWENRGHQPGGYAKMHVDSFWPGTFKSLCALAADPETRPDFIFGDYQVEAAKDAAMECGIPYAVCTPQFPWYLPAPHVPGLSGLHERALCTEGDSWADRLWELSFPWRRAPDVIQTLRYTKAMRWEAGLRRMAHSGPLDHLLLVNSFEGFEIPRDLSPNCAAVGPLIRDDYPGLPESTAKFLDGRKRVAYVAFGTHVTMDRPTLDKVTHALAELLDHSLLDGVILVTRAEEYQQLEKKGSGKWHVMSFAPQRAILAHPSTAVFITHAGPSSVHEGMFHGTPMVSLAIYGDQISNALRLERAGVGRRLHPAHFSALDLNHAVREILRDEDGVIARNVLRLQRIATIASRRKDRAADLIEEHMYDWELRGDRPMHLQSPSARLSWIKLHNLDIWVPLLALLVLPGLLVQQYTQATIGTVLVVASLVIATAISLFALAKLPAFLSISVARKVTFT